MYLRFPARFPARGRDWCRSHPLGTEASDDVGLPCSQGGLGLLGWMAGSLHIYMFGDGLQPVEFSKQALTDQPTRGHSKGVLSHGKHCRRERERGREGGREGVHPLCRYYTWALHYTTASPIRAIVRWWLLVPVLGTRHHGDGATLILRCGAAWHPGPLSMLTTAQMDYYS